ncbi:hypothetical protein RN001_010829 [Aquatica leii]|uniref:Fucosyltransferase n=1 Tax=Aquatica leii TaxID=1421715 RepID=A0AAN7SNG2_9COLE|nr:hypothetical protein RN001_010829 [Aquatica leii]
MLLLIQYNKSVVSILNFRYNDNADVKHILFWTKFFYTDDYYIGFGSEPFSECEYKNCFITKNRSFLSVDKFDAIIFHGNEFDEKEHKVPSARNPNQIYIFVNGESPVMTFKGLQPFNYFYNWTMTYRSDSEIQFPYEAVVKKDTDYVLPSKDFVQNKTKFMAWFVSRCEAWSRREVLINNLKQYIPIDVYGKCGTLQCPQKPNLSPEEKCLDILENQYKFYFAAENSNCKEYITEKMYNALKKNVIPVVYGGANYTKIAPPNSVINVANFKNVTELVNYLKFLDANPTEYLKYFEWKKHYVIINNQAACQLCQKLNEPLVNKIVKDLHRWSWGPNNENCKSGFPDIISSLL